MRSIFSVLLAVLFCIPAVASAADKKADFSGKWAFNEGKSQLGDSQHRRIPTEITITQKGNDLTMVRISTRQSGEIDTATEKYTLDGKECQNTARERTKKSTVVVAKDGLSLTITSSTEFERNGEKMEVKMVEIFKLAEKDQLLSIDVTSTSSRGEYKATYAYDKAVK